MSGVTMRKLIVSNLISLDGYASGPVGLRRVVSSVT